MYHVTIQTNVHKTEKPSNQSFDIFPDADRYMRELAAGHASFGFKVTQHRFNKITMLNPDTHAWAVFRVRRVS